MPMSNPIETLSGMVAVVLAAGAMALPCTPSFAAELPPEAVGIWALNCANTKSPRVTIANNSVTVTTGGKRLRYGGVDISWSWVGGNSATGDRAWVLVSKKPNGPFEFIVEVAMTGKTREIKLEEGNPDNGRPVSPLFGKRLVRC